MPRKIDLITELYKRAIKDITSDSVVWRAFLHSAAYQYKYPFADQVLIYAQKPFATACAETELWNGYFGRWVKRGATGIALFDRRGSKQYLRYVFDVSDTYQRENKPFDIWEIKPEYEPDVIEALQNRFIDDDKDIEKVSDAVISAVINLGADNITDYLQELIYGKEGSFLEELDEDNLRMRLLTTVQASVVYTVLTRLGYNADNYVGKEFFQWIHEFNTPSTVNILGSATSDISEMCLREIERTVKSVEKNVQREIRTFDGKDELGYNDGGRAEKENENGGIINDIILQDTERSADPELGTARADRLSNREVRSDETTLYEGTPQRNLHDDTDRGKDQSVSSRDRRDGERADIGDYEPTGDEPWDNGADESRESDSVGAYDEQYQSVGGGRSVEQSNLRISDSTLPEISDPNSLIQILRHGGYLRRSKKEIVSFLRSDASKEEKVEYVKKAYPPLLFAEFYKEGTEEHLGYRADEEGLLAYIGNFPSRSAEMRMGWEFVTGLIDALIKDKNYLDEPPVQESKQMSIFDVDIPNHSERLTDETFPESEYELHLGTTVYIGKDECEIVSLSKDKVELFDGTLIPLELDYDVFMRRVRDNLLNNHLRKDVIERATEIPKPAFKSESKPKQGRKRKSNEPTIKSLAEELEKEYARWDELLTNGGSDPTWSDGVNMNLVQGRIVADRRRLLEMCGDGEKPAILIREEPPRMSSDYMAKADEIREAARKSLEIYKSNPTYQWCKAQMGRIPAKILKNSLIPNMLSYVSSLEEYIEKGDLVAMRRHRNPERYIDSFDTCKREIEKLLSQIEHEQITDDIFNKLMDNATVADEQPQYPKDVHIYIDTDREEIVWMYYNPDAASGGQFVTNTLTFAVFKEAYDDFSTSGGDWNDKSARDKFIDSISDMADCYIADISTPFFVESQADYEEKPDYVGFTSDNIQHIGQDIENHLIDLEAERAGNAYEAEFGADGYRVFPGNRPTEELFTQPTLWQRYEQVKQLYSEAVAAIRVGDFYEFFGDDAERVAKLLDLTLTTRQTDGADRIPMCGIPFHATEMYFSKLLDAGIRIAIDDDDLTPKILLPNTGKQEKRFVVVESEDVVGDPYEVWDGVKNAIHIDEDGNRSTFITRWQAEDFASELNRWEYEKTQDRSSELFYEDTESEENTILTDRQKTFNESPDRYSIRFMPYEGGRVAIWDAAIKKYIGGNGQLYIFAEQSEAIRYLFDLQRENGIPETVIFTTEHGNTYHPGDIFLASFDGTGEVRIVIDRVDMYDVWYTMPSESQQEAISMERTDFERYLDEGNITVPNTEYIVPEYTDEKIVSERSENKELERAKEYIREYLIREFDEREDHFENLGKIELAYTTVSDEDIPIQANINLVDFKLEKYLGDVLVEEIQFSSLKEMNENLLSHLEFADLTDATDDEIERYWSESQKEIPQLAKTSKPRKNFPVYNSHPEIPDDDKHNYRITDDEIGMGGAKEKFRKNIDAIKLLYQLEAENRLATPDEQEILAQYSGWGGIADAFDETKDNWHSEYNELKSILSPEEYEAARDSTLTAFFTPPVIIKAMYKAIENMGFKRGNILEPSCGVGNFMGLVPESMDTKMYGVEIDSIAGRIARQLYQKNGITISGYEKTDFPDSFFDVAIGNVPFNDIKILDKKYDKYNFLIHDYFFGATRS